MVELTALPAAGATGGEGVCWPEGTGVFPAGIGVVAAGAGAAVDGVPVGDVVVGGTVGVPVGGGVVGGVGAGVTWPNDAPVLASIKPLKAKA